jgi:DNA-binding transcriptional LysR family regulator
VLRGTLTVAAPVLFGQLHVMPVVTEFLQSHPALDARVELHDRVVSMAAEGVDVAVRIGTLPDSALRAHVVGHVRRVICASPAYLRRKGAPRTVEALSHHDGIAFLGTTAIPDRWSFAAGGERERAVRVRARLTVDSGQAAIDAAVAGLGLVRVLSYQVEHLLRQKKLRVILPELEPQLPVQVVQLPGVPTRAATAFVALAVERLRALLGGRRSRRGT